MMDKIAKQELAVLIGAAVIFLVLLLPSLHHTQQEHRDGIRRTEIAERKIQLEQYYNKHNVYPPQLAFDASPHIYHVVVEDAAGAQGYYLRAKLENSSPNTTGFDAEAGRNYHYRVLNIDGTTYYDVCGGEYSCE